MPERPTRGSGGCLFHVMNRATEGQLLFHKPAAYEDFLYTLRQARERIPMRLHAYCLMPNHWHLLLWPAADGELPRFMQWLSMTHALRLRTMRGTKGRGAVYQGRYKAVVVFSEAGFYRVVRYIERNPVRASLVDRAEHWAWSSATKGDEHRIVISRWPVERPDQWIRLVNDGQSAVDVDDIRGCIQRNQAIGPPPDAPQNLRT